MDPSSSRKPCRSSTIDSGVIHSVTDCENILDRMPGTQELVRSTLTESARCSFDAGGQLFSADRLEGIAYAPLSDRR